MSYPLAVALAGCPRHPPALRAAALELAMALYLERRPHRPLFPRALWVLDAKNSASIDPGSVIAVSLAFSSSLCRLRSLEARGPR